ncbi:hypothetical protein RYZ26_17210 [Terasakiella sp. A23]|uniref:hypothetical protein n=1 Tax=Terasakiella sp. FCG-A23 TaxID=3080561 RepID=UPI0029538874|nr:hypothetical protein [Terasakiella sp. A23]MDV7341351.1 hypothetical protein [Terasakiella sp. A23]
MSIKIENVAILEITETYISKEDDIEQHAFEGVFSIEGKVFEFGGYVQTGDDKITKVKSQDAWWDYVASDIVKAGLVEDISEAKDIFHKMLKEIDADAVLKFARATVFEEAS